MGWLWGGFILFVLAILALDLVVFHRRPHEVRLREALAWSGFWMGLAVAFSAFVHVTYQHHWFGVDLPGGEPDGSRATVLYLTAWLVEKSLSIDNLFVIAMMFEAFGVPALYQHRVLFWGVLGAVVMRGVMIGIGTALILRFQWVLYIFGALLLASATRMLVPHRAPDPRKSGLVRIVRSLVPVSDRIEGAYFTTRIDGRLALTPLGIALLVVESADLVFAVDSVPAVLAITQDPFLVFASNVLAILGMRALYFALADIVDRFRYLKVSLAILLGLVGLKLILKDFLHAVPGVPYWTIAVIVVVLAGGIAASLVWAPRRAEDEP